MKKIALSLSLALAGCAAPGAPDVTGKTYQEAVKIIKRDNPAAKIITRNSGEAAVSLQSARVCAQDTQGDQVILTVVSRDLPCLAR